MPGSYPAILDQLGRGPPVRMQGVSGGCIANAGIAYFRDGTEVFVKSGGSARSDMFRTEAEGLRELSRANALRVPGVLLAGDNSIVLECIRPGPRKPEFFEEFGRRFARLHRYHGRLCGFREDNFIGSTAQINTPLGGLWEECRAPEDSGADWPAFFFERRLRFQAELAVENGFGSHLLNLLDRAGSEIIKLLGEAIEPPSLLHGDLWSGNFIVDEHGVACLIDPAVYYGHREADLAMTHLFGGFGPDFYRTYDEVFPLSPGHRERRPVYQLYHLLNHLNLFGRSYFGQCENILKMYTR